MATMAMDMVKKKSKLATIIVASILSQHAIAGEWKFSPGVFLDETYSNNVQLTSDNKQSSLVTQSGLRLNSSYKGRLLDFNFTSNSIYALYSHDHDIDNDFHTLSSDFKLKLGQQGFSIIGRANIANRSRNSVNNSLADIVSNDTVQVKTYSYGLAYQQQNSDFIIDSNFTYSTAQSNDNIGESNGYIVSFITKNGKSNRTIFWDIQSNYQERKNRGKSAKFYQGELKLGLITDLKLNPFLRYYDEDNNGSFNRRRSTESNAYGLGVRWLVTPRLQLDVSYNKPIGNTLDINDEKQSAYVDVSLNWQPSIRTTLNANFSQRFFGDSYGIKFSHKSRRLTNTINYQEQVQSFTRNNYNPVSQGVFWCPDGDTSNINNCFIGNNQNIDLEHFQLIELIDYELIEDNVLSLNKTLSWSSKLALARTTFSLQFNATNRENLETSIEDERSSMSVTASRKVSGRSDINLKASYTDNLFQKDTDNERQDRYRQVSIGYKKSLNSSLSFNFDIAHVNRNSNTQQFNYEEGRVTFKITKDF